MAKKKQILITGGTGLVGRDLRQKLDPQMYEIGILSRKSVEDGVHNFIWDYTKDYIDPEAIEFADVIIHLAGENVSRKRWSYGQKKRIIESRVKTGNLLVDAIGKAKDKPKKFISASAIGYYGAITSAQVFTEEDSPGNDFLAKTVVAWEKSVDPISDMGVVLHKLRIGVVLSDQGGAMRKMDQTIKTGLGSALGSGKQWMPWVSLNDLSRILIFLMQADIKGDIFNAVAPQHIQNDTFMHTLAKVLGKPFFMPKIPSSILKMRLGEMAEIVLQGSRISSQKLINLGFRFEDADLEDTLKKIYN